MHSTSLLPEGKNPVDLRAFADGFAKDGYAIVRGLFADRIAALEAAFDRIVAQISATGEDINARWHGDSADRLGTGTVVQHTHQVQCYSAEWAQLWFDTQFLDHLEAILGPDIILHHTKLFQKPTERGAAFPLHQDYAYFPVEGDRGIAAIVHVSQATDAMGCLRVIPGSHRLGRVDPQGGLGALTKVQHEYDIHKAIPIEAQPGDVLFFHCLTLHGSLINSSHLVRKTVLGQFHAGGARIESDRPHANSRLVLRGWNPLMTRSQAAQSLAT